MLGEPRLWNATLGVTPSYLTTCPVASGLSVVLWWRPVQNLLSPPWLKAHTPNYTTIAPLSCSRPQDVASLSLFLVSHTPLPIRFLIANSCLLGKSNLPSWHPAWNYSWSSLKPSLTPSSSASLKVTLLVTSLWSLFSPQPGPASVTPGALHTKRGPLLVYCSPVAILTLIVLSLNLCFVSEVWWDKIGDQFTLGSCSSNPCRRGAWPGPSLCAHDRFMFSSWGQQLGHRVGERSWCIDALLVCVQGGWKLSLAHLATHWWPPGLAGVKCQGQSGSGYIAGPGAEV